MSILLCAVHKFIWRQVTLNVSPPYRCAASLGNDPVTSRRAVIKLLIKLVPMAWGS